MSWLRHLFAAEAAFNNFISQSHVILTDLTDLSSEKKERLCSIKQRTIHQSFSFISLVSLAHW
jgi:hypothetical protein